MNENRKEYESPKAEKIEFDFNEHVVASTIPGHPTQFDDEGNPVIDSEHTNYKSDAGCTYFAWAEGCFD